MSGKNDRNFGGIFQKEMLIYAQASVSGIGLVPGRTILCNLTSHAPYSLKIRVLDYLLSEHNYRQFIGSLSAKLKLSFNRDTPTPLLNSDLTYLNAIFILFCYPEGETKSTLGGVKC